MSFEPRVGNLRTRALYPKARRCSYLTRRFGIEFRAETMSSALPVAPCLDIDGDSADIIFASAEEIGQFVAAKRAARSR